MFLFQLSLVILFRTNFVYANRKCRVNAIVCVVTTFFVEFHRILSRAFAVWRSLHAPNRKLFHYAVFAFTSCVCSYPTVFFLVFFR